MGVARFGKTGLAVLAVASIAACSSGSSGSSNSGGVAGAVSPMTELETLATRVDGYANSRFDAVPEEGSATFTGLGYVAVSDDGTDVLAGMGDVTVTVNFETSEITGGLANITGYQGDVAASIAAEDDFEAIAGELVLSRGDLFELRPNAFGVDYDGTLGDDAFVVDGRALGIFKGTRSESSPDFPLRGLTITDDDGIATVGTDTFDVDLTLYGETE